MLLCLHLSLRTELTQPVFSRQPGLPVSASLYGQAVITESVHSHCLSEFVICHSGQIVCHCVLSVQGQIALMFVWGFCGRCPMVYL